MSERMPRKLLDEWIRWADEHRGTDAAADFQYKAAKELTDLRVENERLRGLLREHGACIMCHGRGEKPTCMCDGQTCRPNCPSKESPCRYCKGTGLQEWAAAELATVEASDD